jgi:hypothetical protein
MIYSMWYRHNYAIFVMQVCSSPTYAMKQTFAFNPKSENHAKNYQLVCIPVVVYVDSQISTPEIQTAG